MSIFVSQWEYNFIFWIILFGRPVALQEIHPVVEFGMRMVIWSTLLKPGLCMNYELYEVILVF